MNKLFILFILIFSTSLFAGVSDVKILIVGDSWAKLMCLHNSIDAALEHFTVSTKVSCFSTSTMGSKASQWNRPEKQNTIRKAFIEMKNIEVVILSIGGNDYFSAWKMDLTTEQLQEMNNKIRGDIKKNIEFIQAQKPNLKIVISGYDYANFDVLLQDNYLTHHYLSMFNRVGRPTQEQLNSAFILMNGQYAQLSKEMKNVYFSNHMGLMHYYYGIRERGIKPYATPFPGQYPHYQPLAGGERRFGNTTRVLMTLPFDYKDFVDPYHLNASGYKIIGEHLVGYYVRHMLSK